MNFTDLIDLASERLGGVALAANDEFFAPKENLLKSTQPIFIEDKYTDVGKWMDGWETRRRRTPGHDWCIIRLGLPGIIRGVVVDTTHFKGNYPEACSVEACAVEREADPEQVTRAQTWVEILSKSQLRGDTLNHFPVQNSGRFTHLRLNIYPDGGVARLRVYGEVIPQWARLAPQSEIDLAAVENGGLVVACSDMFFGSRHNLIMPGRARNMGEGWETRRRRGAGHDWVIIKLGAPGTIRRVQVDTCHFKGNYPDRCSLEAAAASESVLEPAALSSLPWAEVLPSVKLQADTQHLFEKELKDPCRVTHVRFNIFPDGGVARLRIFGMASGSKK